MKKFISIISTIIITAAAVICPTGHICRAADRTEYLYTIINNQATITGFEGEPTVIEIPETVEGCRVVELRDNAFYECGSLKHIILPDTIEKIGHHCFYGCYSLESAVIPDSVTVIGMGAFCGCTSMTLVCISSGLTRLPESCFRSCESMKTVTVPDSVTEMGDFCFSGCKSLENVSLGNSVKSVGDCAFYMCSSMTGLYIPASVENIGVCAAGYIPTKDGAQRVDGFTIIGEKKSAAQTYAKENQLTFECASDAVHAFAVQRVSGRRIGIPTVYLIGGAVIIFLAAVILSNKKKLRRK